MPAYTNLLHSLISADTLQIPLALTPAVHYKANSFHFANTYQDGFIMAAQNEREERMHLARCELGFAPQMITKDLKVELISFSSTLQAQ